MHDEYSDTEPLLPASTRSAAELKSLQSGEEFDRQQRNTYKDIAVSIALPWVCFTVLLLLFTVYRDFKLFVWCFASASFLFAILLVCVGGAARHGAFLLLGSTTLASVCSGVMVGYHMDSEYLAYYNTVRDGVVYKNVDATGHAGAKVDAGVLLFANDTLVDDRRTVGFVADGTIHCVAPVAKETIYSRSVQYWATGTDCCQRRSNFDCGTAMASIGARSAIVAKPSEHFASAIEEAVSVYNLRSTSEALLLTFVDDPVKARDDIWECAIYTVLVSVVVHFLVMSTAVVLVFQALPQAMSPRGGEEYLANYAMGKAPGRKATVTP